MWFHFVARVEHPHRPFLDRWACVRTWRILSRNFPGAMACVLMPNHVHLILQSSDAAQDHRRFRGALSILGLPWQPFPEPQPVPDKKHLWRLVRYTHLNPCRSFLCDDPLKWEWSTYRDYVGAAWPRWPDLDLVRKNLGWSRVSDWPALIHARTSADQTVKAEGTPTPRLHSGEQAAHASVEAICTAGLRVFRIMPQRLQERFPFRAAIVQCAEKHQGVDVQAFCERFSVTRKALWNMRQRPVPRGAAQALALVLSDRRLLGEVHKLGTSGVK